MSSLLSYVWLSLKRGLGNYLRAEVLRRMGSPEAVYAATAQCSRRAVPVCGGSISSCCATNRRTRPNRSSRSAHARHPHPARFGRRLP